MLKANKTNPMNKFGRGIRSIDRSFIDCSGLIFEIHEEETAKRNKKIYQAGKSENPHSGNVFGRKEKTNNRSLWTVFEKE